MGQRNSLQIATVSLSGSLEEKLVAASEAGFDGVEIFENDLVASDLSPAEIRQFAAELNLRTDLYQPFRDLEGWSGVDRQRAFDRAAHKLDLMDRLGCSTMLLASNVQRDTYGDYGRIAADLHELGEMAAARDKRIAYEALSWGAHVYDHRQAWDIVKRTDHPAIGLTLDSFHSLARKIPSSSLLDIDPAKIFFVQLADAPLLALDYLTWSRHHRSMPGEGELPVLDYVAVLLARGYEGPLSLEVFNDRFRAASRSLTAHDGIRALHALVADAKRKLGVPGGIPAHQHCDGIEFIEFAAARDEADRLEEMLTGLGFQLAGQHRTKHVTRWRQGAINIVVNREQRNFAHTYDTVHGAAVCAIGLKVTDSAATFERAQAIGMQRFSEVSDDSGLALQGLRSISGSLAYIVDSSACDVLWQTEFDPVAGEAPPSPGLTNVDHISATVHVSDFLPAQQFWTSLFDLEKDPIVNVADPAGLVESQALQNAGGELRITLNASAASNTLANLHIHRTFGAPYQHLAFATHDIIGTARILAERNIDILPIPANYYEDLKARWGLDDDFVDALAALNILYDRDDRGDYFQLYTRAYERRFFFEIVQRRGYRGYGAINAPVRLAAQTRLRSEFERH